MTGTDRPVAGRMVAAVSAAPVAPPACRVFDPAELEARIAAHAARVAAEEPDPDRPDPPRCFGCGAAGKPGLWLRRHGWVTRRIRGCGGNEIEVQCPACFVRHGWQPIGTTRADAGAV